LEERKKRRRRRKPNVSMSYWNDLEYPLSASARNVTTGVTGVDANDITDMTDDALVARSISMLGDHLLVQATKILMGIPPYHKYAMSGIAASHEE
jgi:hypothetical protein